MGRIEKFTKLFNLSTMLHEHHTLPPHSVANPTRHGSVDFVFSVSPVLIESLGGLHGCSLSLHVLCIHTLRLTHLPCSCELPRQDSLAPAEAVPRRTVLAASSLPFPFPSTVSRTAVADRCTWTVSSPSVALLYFVSPLPSPICLLASPLASARCSLPHRHLTLWPFTHLLWTVVGCRVALHLPGISRNGSMSNAPTLCWTSQVNEKVKRA